MTIAFLHELIHVLSSSNGLPDGFEYPETNLLEPTVQLVTKLYALKNPNIISTKDIDKYYKESTEKLEVVIKLIGEKYLSKILFMKYRNIGDCKLSSSKCIFANAIIKRIPFESKKSFGKDVKNLPSVDELAKKVREKGVTILFTTWQYTEISGFFKEYEKHLRKEKILS